MSFLRRFGHGFALFLTLFVYETPRTRFSAFFVLVPRCLPQIALQSRKSGRQSRLFGIEPNKETRQSSKGYIH